MPDPCLYNDCDLNCPRIWGKHNCCMNCAASRREFYEAAGPEARKAWDDRHGFWHPTEGCRLDRSQRPPECLAYDCADQLFLVGSARWEGGWPLIIREMPKATATEDECVQKAREIWREMHERAILTTSRTDSSIDRALEHRDGPTVYVLHGMIGSGKSTWAKKFCQENPRARIVSADEFRRMLHGRYEYHAEMDDAIANAMRDTAVRMLAEGYDVVIDCGNLTRARREPWLTLGITKKVAIRMPAMHKSWHLGRRQADPHWKTDWGKVYDGERAAIEPLDEEGWTDVIPVHVSEVTSRKILILSASPVRDRRIDELIATKLRALGHTVEISPCLRGGREKVLEYRPDIVIVPPIRNPNSRDMVEELKRFGCAVVVRHTEPSCSWQDWKRMDARARMEILGGLPYPGDIELVWSADEAAILNRFRQGSPHCVPVGAIGLDIYFNAGRTEPGLARAEFRARYGFDADKPILLVTSPWGFADSSPDLGTDSMADARRDLAGRDAHLAMTREVVTSLRGSWNILLSIHHGVEAGPYQQLAAELGVPLEMDLPMMDMLPHCDAIVHAGSTAAVSAHLLGVGGFQYGDVNAKEGGNWWGLGESAISRVSPRFETPADLVAAIRAHPGGSNANLDTIRELEEGRYGLIDGKATDRAVKFIDRLRGRFRPVWPRSANNYSQLSVQRSLETIGSQARCNVCGQTFAYLTDEYVKTLAVHLQVPTERIRPPHSVACPHCGARMYTT